MIIGVSGRLGHGKDLVGEMFQYIGYLEHGGKYDFNSFETMKPDTKEMCSKWKIEKFGGKLKDMICILLGCTREQLEDRTFKEKELGEEWWYYKSAYNSQLYTLGDREELNSRGQYLIGEILLKLTPRLMLQLMGTECGREILHPDIWVNATLGAYHPNDKWIITDVRFPNEIDRIEKLGGIVIRVVRDIETITNEHFSETALDHHDFEYVIQNNGTKQELLEKVEKIYKKIQK